MIYKEYEDVKPIDFLRELKIYKDSRLLAIDIGTKKLGFAVCDFDSFTPIPLKNISISEICSVPKLLNEYNIIAIIAGVSEASEGDKKGKHTEFIRRNISKELPLYFINETSTSKAADELLKETGLKRKKRNAIDDKIAAMLILRAFVCQLPFIE